MKIKIFLRHNSESLSLEINTEDSLFKLKEMISKILNIEPNRQVLEYKEEVLRDDLQTIESYKIKDKSTIILKLNKFNMNIRSTNISSSRSNKYDEMIDGLDDGKLKNIMNNPSFQEEMLSMSQDPNYLKQQMKNFDLTVSKLENMPGGFNIINSMMKDVQDPMLDLLSTSKNYKEGDIIQRPIYDPIPGTSRENLLIKYREELALLRAMGYENSKRNLSALIACQGNIVESIEYLNNNK
ncbi:ubiquitin domain-containing protein [Vairimorpha necatrix]|uniref:Ubiquitin domain-containing protein n=1 Tax=Vairimorpha necatrix TaxID=6039 RepID=A0AAX4JEI7_9MICR